MSGEYRIEVWNFPVLGANSPVSHRFVVLVDCNNRTVKELHGGAAGPEGTFKTTAFYGTLFTKEGTPGLTASDGTPLGYERNPIASTGEGLTNNHIRVEYVVDRGSKADMERGWAAANAAGELINGKNLLYVPPPTGFKRLCECLGKSCDGCDLQKRARLLRNSGQ
jgi:hypothetical protein